MVALPLTLDDLMMAQQPIFKKSKDIFGYELLFREADNEQAKMPDDDIASSQVLVNLCISITEKKSQTNTSFFINMTKELILSDAFLPIDPETMYIEILEEQKLTLEFIAAVKKWCEAGYRFVLDNYQFNLETKKLLPWVSIVKIHVLTTPPKQYLHEIAELKTKGLTLLAKEINDKDTFELCENLGFDLYQGNYLQYPEIIKGRKISVVIHDAIKLVNALQDKDVDIEEITDLISKSPKLSYQLLRILNSPICGISKTVSSIKEAVILLGLVQLKKWALLITLTSSQDKPSPLLKTLLTRGYCCQLLAESKQSENVGSAFMVGLMSGIDLVFNLDKKMVLEHIALDPSTFDAIMNQTGELGTYLTQVLSCEEQNWEYIAHMDSNDRSTLNHSFLNAMLWSEEVMSSIN